MRFHSFDIFVLLTTPEPNAIVEHGLPVHYTRLASRTRDISDPCSPILGPPLLVPGPTALFLRLS